MEVSGVVLRKPSLCFSKELEPFSPASVLMGRRRSVKVSDQFCDKGHFKYYYYHSNSSPSPSSSVMMMRCEKQEINKGLKKMKKIKKHKLKLLKGLSRDLSTFTQIGFGLDSDQSLLDRVKGNIISDATEILLEQLQKLRAEKKELKRKKKEEKSRSKASQIQNRFMSCEMSSSSSSESSSDSECGEIVDMKSLKRPQSDQNTFQPVVEDSISPSVSLSQPHVTESIPVLVLASVQESGNLENECVNTLDNKICSKKIEVCMGGKCKKSGAAALLDEFQKVVGIEGAVSGCKCMGKCRDGPNVKILNEGVEDNIVKSSSNPLCVGVGLEDVGTIVSNFLGDNQNQLEFAA